MEIRRRKLAIALALIVVLGGIVFALFPHEPPEPVYQGKKLSEWLAYYGNDFNNNGNVAQVWINSPPGWAERRTADEAVRKAGTNAIPTLLRFLRARDTPFKLTWQRFALRLHLIKAAPPPAHALNMEAMFGFRVLGEAARFAVPDLIEILRENRSESSLVQTISSLNSIGPAASNAIPQLLLLATNRASVIRSVSVEALQTLKPQPDVMLQSFVRGLSDPSVLVRNRSVAGLKALDTNALPAVPGLVAIFADNNNPGQRDAENLLLKFDSSPTHDVVVPAILPLLHDPDPKLRGHAVQFLGKCRRDALDAVPALLQSLNDSDPEVKRLAGIAIRYIDPNAAEKAGIK